ncbi:MAG: hypothetical protein GWN31_14175 [Candidatus Thorarchaeota archaeon]|nr:hypothetical protein [Candidatus Thorarchaeota archaeon]NIW15041.1 hypothetical protein [Candidatus Thorarchaeota archaeon]NIW53051.1 hypothetical protein [Candidatus Korarchaeota archaeon]
MEPRTLVIAELHLGKPLIRDRKLSEQEIIQTFGRIRSLINEYNSKEVLILGDVKEQIGLPPKPVQRKIRHGFESILNHTDRVKIIKGNHDGRIEDFLDIEGISFAYKEERRVGSQKVVLFHGHKFFPVNTYDIAITAHIHPAANISSDTLAVPIVKTWAIFDLIHQKGEAKWVILPAFSPWITGVSLNTLPKNDIKRLMPFKGKNEIEIKRLELLYTDLTPLVERSFSLL